MLLLLLLLATCCHLYFTCPIGSSFRFHSTRVFLSMQLMASNCGLATAAAAAACCLLQSIARATRRRRRRQRCSDAKWSACSYFRLPHFVANSSSNSSSSVRHPKTGVAFGLCNTHATTSDPNFVALTQQQQQLQGQHAKQSWVCSAGQRSIVSSWRKSESFCARQP